MATMGDISGWALTLGIAGIIIGVVLTILGKLAAQSSLTAKAAAALNLTVDAIYDFVTWFGIIVLVAAAIVLLVLVIKGLGRAGAGRG